MRDYFYDLSQDFGRISDATYETPHTLSEDEAQDAADRLDLLHCARKPLSHIWLGVSAEDQVRAEARIPDLLATPAAVRFVSAEPLLGPVDLTRVSKEHTTLDVLQAYRATPTETPGVYLHEPTGGPRLDWVICGGESGRDARPMHPGWARALRNQCQAAGVAFFMKQMTRKAPIPDDLLIREYPNA